MDDKSKLFLKASALFLVFFVVLCSILHRPVLVCGSDEASSKIDEAEHAVQHAFVSVSQAGQAGANVSSLMVRLDEAGRLLAEARMADRNNNTSEAFSKAEESRMKADAVTADAVVLRDSSSENARTVFWSTIMFSLVGSIAFVGALVYVWIRFKRFYAKKLLNKKPEVISHAEA